MASSSNNTVLHVVPRETSLIIINSARTLPSRMKVVNLLEEMEWDSLFLSLPSSWEDAIIALRQGFDFPSVLEEMESLDLIRLPEDQNILSSYRPLLEALIDADLERKVRCYRDPISFEREREISLDMMVLALRGRLGSLDLEEWKELLREDIHLSKEESRREVPKLSGELEDQNVCLDCSRDMERELKRTGTRLEKIVVDSKELPWNQLKQEMREYESRGEEIPDDLLEERIREHLDLLELIMNSASFEEALGRWSETS